MCNTPFHQGLGARRIVYPVIEDLKKEKEPVEFLITKLGEIECSTLVGYNILHFDIPYLVYKAGTIGKDANLSRFKILDLFWVLPYWLHNVPSGKAFLKTAPHLGNLWKLEKVVEYFLGENPNPFSNKDVPRLWERKQFREIEKHLEFDLIHTFSFLKSSLIQEALDHVQRQHFDMGSCREMCPFRQFLLKSPERAFPYCTLLQKQTSDERRTHAIDIIDYPLPARDITWVPPCAH